jgi:hypothetical protein
MDPVSVIFREWPKRGPTIVEELISFEVVAWHDGQ